MRVFYYRLFLLSTVGPFKRSFPKILVGNGIQLYKVFRNSEITWYISSTYSLYLESAILS